MRAVERNFTKIQGILAEYQGTKKKWDDLDSGHKICIKEALREEFAELCAYCEEKVPGQTKLGPKVGPGQQEEKTVPGQTKPGPIEHFRPRNPITGTQEQLFGADFTFDPLNLFYCCVHCQLAKDNKWPGTWPTHVEDLVNGVLRDKAKKDGWEFVPVRPEIGYVCPNGDQPRPAEDFFRYHQNGRIVPNESLGCEERSRALRTIYDLGLNDCDLMERRRKHLENLNIILLEAKGRKKMESQRRRIYKKHKYLNDVTPKSNYEVEVQFTRYILCAFEEKWILSPSTPTAA